MDTVRDYYARLQSSADQAIAGRLHLLIETREVQTAPHRTGSDASFSRSLDRTAAALSELVRTIGEHRADG
jgi:hypothetical protein